MLSTRIVIQFNIVQGHGSIGDIVVECPLEEDLNSKHIHFPVKKKIV